MDWVSESQAAVNSLDETHDPGRRSWVPGAEPGSDFPVQNLPLGIFSPTGEERRAGAAIAESIVTSC